MLKNLKTKFKFKNLIAVFLTPILLLGFLVGQTRADEGHIVISEIQVGGEIVEDEFIELYNPTNQEINLENWDLKRKTSAGIESNTLNNIQGVIKPHGYFLIIPRANCGESKIETCYKGNKSGDGEYTTNSFLARENTILLYDNNGVIIDEVAWNELSSGQSIERKALQSGVCVSAQNSGESLGNGCDKDNIDDFEIRDIPNPQNSTSSTEPTIENSQALTPSSIPVPCPNSTSEPSSSPVATTTVSQSVPPVAEAGVDKEAVIGENIDFDGSDSYDSLGKALKYIWDFGDEISGKGINVSHRYSVVGEYNVILKVDNGEDIGEDALKVKIVTPEFSDKIILSEILPNPNGVDTDSEWIEIYNSGDKKVNLKGWILASSAKSGGKQYIFSGDNIVEAKSYLVVKRSESNLVLTNESGKVSLMWPPDKIMSEVIYGSAKEGKSYAFIGNAWQWADVQTPGKVNSVIGSKIETAKAKDSNLLLANIAGSLSLDNQEIMYDEEDAVNGAATKTAVFSNNVPQPLAGLNIEDFLDQLISEKVDKAFLKASAGEILSDKNVPALADNSEDLGIDAKNEETACEEFCKENNKNSVADNGNVRNNPWFWGDLALSALCLFFVWRYQEVRKRLV